MTTESESAPTGVPQQAPVDATAPATTTSPTTVTTATTATTATTPSTTDFSKPIHTLILDTGPLIKNDPPISSLLAQAECLVTIPSVVDEIRDPATRSRVDTQLRPFLTLRTPKPASVKFVSDFARKTGDLEVLSRPDLQLLALTYELECERNGGDWRLRNTPTQKGVNGKSPAAAAAAAAAEAAGAETAGTETAAGEEAAESAPEAASEAQAETTETTETKAAGETTEAKVEPTLEDKVADLTIEKRDEKAEAKVEPAETVEEGDEDAEDDDDDGGEWITPSNLKKVQEKERTGGAPTQKIDKVRLQAALLTSDFAMQNVALRINLNLLSSGLDRITRVKTWVQRCHGCFAVTRQMEKQFCPQCGQATLTRTSCATDAATGEFRLYLKRNFQYNKRGNVYSVPKPIHGSASGKLSQGTQGGRGGQGGWGRELILSEDQQEFTKKAEEQRRLRMRDMMDEDYLPGLLTGIRHGQNQRVRVGAGRNVNSKKR